MRASSFLNYRKQTLNNLNEEGEIKPGKKVKLNLKDVLMDPSLLQFVPDEKTRERAEFLANEIKKLQDQLDQLDTEHRKVKREIEHYDPDLYKILSLIKRDCKVFLQDVKTSDDFLYRGIRKTPGRYFKGASRNSRRVKDSSNEIQKFIDMVLKAAGFTALRSNSIFTTTSKSNAGGYGDTFLIFPIDGFQFTYSNHRDLYSDLSTDSVRMFVNNFFPKNLHLMDVEKGLAEFDKIYREPFENLRNNAKALYDQALLNKEDSNIELYRSAANILGQLHRYIEHEYGISYIVGSLNGLESLIQELNGIPDVMKAIGLTPKFLAAFKKDSNKLAKIDADSKKLSNYKKLITPETIPEIVNYHGFTNKNLANGMNKGVEIYIHGAYYAIKFDNYSQEDFIKKMLLT